MASLPLPHPCLIVLIGPPASGKSTWAADNVRADQIVSSDALRAVVGTHELDLEASADVFDLVERIVDLRSGRKLTTVVDTTGLDGGRRAAYLEIGRRHGLAAVAVRFTTSAAECKRRNRERAHPVPVKVIDSMVKTAKALNLESEEWDLVLDPEPVRVVTPKLASLARDQDKAAVSSSSERRLKFGLHISSFDWVDETIELGPQLVRVARAAEDAGFNSLWVMDHMIQIPQLGSAWDPMLESYTTLGFIAGATERIKLGVLVSPATYRHVGVLAKTIATLDVLSGGRAIAGLGAGNHEREHVAYGMPFPSAPGRLSLLEDVLQALPLFWGPGSPAFKGNVLAIPEAQSYPRPLQDPLPIVVGGSGEKVTLRLAARYASGCNLFGDPASVAAKVAVLHKHCAAVGRDPAEVEVTHLSTVLVGRDRRDLDARIDRLRSPRQGPDAYAASVNAGTIEDHVSRLTALTKAGVDHAIISTPDLADSSALETLGELVARHKG